MAWWSSNIVPGSSSSLSWSPLDCDILVTCSPATLTCVFSYRLASCEPEEVVFSCLTCAFMFWHLSFLPAPYQRLAGRLLNPIMLSCGLACWKGEAGSLTPGRDAFSRSVWSLPLYYKLGQTPLDQMVNMMLPGVTFVSSLFCMFLNITVGLHNEYHHFKTYCAF